MSDQSPTAELRGRKAAALVRDLNRAAEILLGEAQRRAPIEEGTLRGSGTIIITVNGQEHQGAGALAAATHDAEQAARAGRRVDVQADVGFTSIYAARQHEETSWHHPKGGQAKYLSTPLNSLAGRFVALIAAGQSGTL